VAVAADPYDIAVLENGMVLLSGGRGEWTDIAVVDIEKETIAARWGGIWRQSLLQVAPDSKRVYVSTQGVSPGSISALVVPEKLDDKPATYTSPSASTFRLGGEFTVTADGKYLLCKTGSVLRVSDDRQEDLQGVATLEPFLATSVSPKDGWLFLLTDEGTLKQYSYPEFKPAATYRLGVVGYQMALDPTTGRLYVAAVDPKSLGGRGAEKSAGGVYVYPLREQTK
jgi:DNA-binding beta-propeller fold protein YncE